MNLTVDFWLADRFLKATGADEHNCGESPNKKNKDFLCWEFFCTGVYRLSIFAAILNSLHTN